MELNIRWVEQAIRRAVRTGDLQCALAPEITSAAEEVAEKVFKGCPARTEVCAGSQNK